MCSTRCIIYVFPSNKRNKSWVIKKTLTKNLLLDGASTLLKTFFEGNHIFLIPELGYLGQIIPKF